MDGSAGMTAVGASTASRVQPRRDDEVILVSLDETCDLALGDGKGNVHVNQDGEAGSAHHPTEAIHRHPRKVSENRKQGNPQGNRVNEGGDKGLKV
jgi:hypothetical protein